MPYTAGRYLIVSGVMTRTPQGEEAASWKLTVRLEPALRPRLVARVARTSTKSIAAYVKSLIEADLAGPQLYDAPVLAGVVPEKPSAPPKPQPAPNPPQAPPPKPIVEARKITDHKFRPRSGNRPFICFVCGAREDQHA